MINLRGPATTKPKIITCLLWKWDHVMISFAGPARTKRKIITWSVAFQKNLNIIYWTRQPRYDFGFCTGRASKTDHNVVPFPQQARYDFWFCSGRPTQIDHNVVSFEKLFYWNLYWNPVFPCTFLLKSILPLYFSIEISISSSLFDWNFQSRRVFFAAWDDPTSSYRCNRSRSRKLQNVLGAQGVLGVVLKGPQIKI